MSPPRAPPRPTPRWLLLAALACGPEARPAPREAPVPTLDRPPASPAPDPSLLAAYPALAHYPSVPPELVAALRTRDARPIFRGLVRAFAATRAANADAWERLAHIRIAAPSGFCRTEAGAPVPLPPGTLDLGCFGGFLEAVRALYLPDVELDALILCDPPHSFESCDEGAHAGRAALIQIGARLPATELPRGLTLLDLPADAAHPDLAAALEGDALYLCTVSHAARAREGLRMYHHMMILDPPTEPRDRVRVFDTTGSRGVAYRAMSPDRLHTYVRRLLALNKHYRYDPESARLTCLAVRRPAPETRRP